jgi:hypothetical protein
LFFSFFFSKLSTWSLWPSPPWSSSICSTTWNIYQPISHILRAHRLVARVSSIHQTQTRAFNGSLSHETFELSMAARWVGAWIFFLKELGSFYTLMRDEAKDLFGFSPLKFRAKPPNKWSKVCRWQKGR